MLTNSMVSHFRDMFLGFQSISNELIYTSVIDIYLVLALKQLKSSFFFNRNSYRNVIFF